MGYEIDFLAVGDKSKSGDAITARWGDLQFGTRQDQSVAVIDGGFKDTGTELIAHIQRYYDTSHIDLMISTHPDDDHIRGLITVMESDEVTVDQLWMHRPWDHNERAALTKFAKATRASAEAGSFDAYVANARELHDIAHDKGVKIVEPFAGHITPLNGGDLLVAGPSKAYYEDLVPQFGTAATKMQKSLRGALAAILSRAAESLNIETLTDDGQTSAANNSSVITMLSIDGRQLLLTGDAGMPALQEARPNIDARRHGQPLAFVQVPHHGSRHNVGPTILDGILGLKGQPAELGSAFCSAARENPEAKRPAKMVTNAFRRRGYPVCVTAGQTIRHSHNAPARPGWVTIAPEPLYPEVEDFDD